MQLVGEYKFFKQMLLNILISRKGANLQDSKTLDYNNLSWSQLTGCMMQICKN